MKNIIFLLSMIVFGTIQANAYQLLVFKSGSCCGTYKMVSSGWSGGENYTLNCVGEGSLNCVLGSGLGQVTGHSGKEYNDVDFSVLVDEKIGGGQLSGSTVLDGINIEWSKTENNTINYSATK